MNALLRRLCGKILNNLIQNTNTHLQEKTRCLSNTGGVFSKSVYLLDEEESAAKPSSPENVNKFTSRTHTCGELRRSNVGQRVVLYGWLEYHRMNRFLVLRDSYGETQILIHDKDLDYQKLLDSVPYESIIKVEGTVLSRPTDMFNKKQATGEIEVSAEKVNVINRASDQLPFNIREFQKAKEALRMQYRYLDIRFPQMQHNLRVRSQVLMKMREFLVNNHFVDVETPTLFKATPGGAQEFVVPTRLPGKFYSLVQSPQQFKQMLMAGAIDRYFQVARCYRDEGSKSDRQPEFTQLDIEISFTNVKGVIKLIEELIFYSWPDFLPSIPTSFQKMSNKDALETYGSDKPDLRFDYKLQNCTDLFKTDKKISSVGDFGAFFLTFPKELANLNKPLKEKISLLSHKYPKAKLVQSKVTNTNDWINKISKLLSKDVASKFVEDNKIQDGSVLFLAYGKKDEVLCLLGKIRLEYINFLEGLGITVKKRGLHFLWVVDFPLFEISEETNKLQSAHHPFTAPNPEDLHLLKSEPLKVRALAYDLVLNGNEVGGGSIRIHDPSLQKTVLDILNIRTDTMQHILDMLGSGCPPHGGIALGLDRLLAVMLNATSIRDVIAFPKTFEGKDPVSGAPSDISSDTKKLYHIECTLDENSNKK